MKTVILRTIDDNEILINLNYVFKAGYNFKTDFDIDSKPTGQHKYVVLKMINNDHIQLREDYTVDDIHKLMSENDDALDAIAEQLYHIQQTIGQGNG